MRLSEIEEKARAHKPRIMDIKRANAVLIPLVETEKGVCLLLELRAQSVIQPGEVCFPGGGIKPGESGEEAAIRETVEELGVRREDIELISRFDTKLGLGGLVLYSYIAKLEIKGLSPDSLNKDEVEDCFLVPIEWLAENKPKQFHFTMQSGVPEDFDMSVFGIKGRYDWRRSAQDIAVWNYEGRYIWGLTAAIIQAFLNMLYEG